VKEGKKGGRDIRIDSGKLEQGRGKTQEIEKEGSRYHRAVKKKEKRRLTEKPSSSAVLGEKGRKPGKRQGVLSEGGKKKDMGRRSADLGKRKEKRNRRHHLEGRGQRESFLRSGTSDKGRQSSQ